MNEFVLGPDAWNLAWQEMDSFVLIGLLTRFDRGGCAFLIAFFYEVPFTSTVTLAPVLTRSMTTNVLKALTLLLPWKSRLVSSTY